MKPEGYAFSSVVDDSSANTYIEVEYWNNWVNKYVLSDHSVEGFKNYIKEKQTLIDIDIQNKNLEWDIPETAKVVTSRK